MYKKLHILTIAIIETMQATQFNKETRQILSKMITNLPLSAMDGVQFFCDSTKLRSPSTLGLCNTLVLWFREYFLPIFVKITPLSD